MKCIPNEERKMCAFRVVVLAVFLLSVPLVSCSSGDRSPRFIRCLDDCSESCDLDRYPGVLPLHLRVFGWSCVDECKYQCMFTVTEQDLRSNRAVQQFYGKWPFVRLLGIQEPASVVFSILNGLGHILGWRKYCAAIPSEYQMYSTWKLNMLISVNSWFWSTVFHTRDLVWSERLDYFCATSLVISSIYTFLVRVMIGPESKRGCRAAGTVIVMLFCYHIGYLSLVKFDYGYNMKANVTVGIINMTGWVSWCIKNYHNQRYVWKMAFVTCSVFFLLGLELGDFPPIWWTFDAHSLWHLGTAPLSYYFYSFLVDDARYQLKEERMKMKKK